MNTIRTETPLEIDNREAYRPRLIASQRASRRSGQAHQRCPHRPPCIEPCDAYPNCKLEPYYNERGWRNYDWTTRQTIESRWTNVAMVLMLLGGMALFAWSIAGYQETVISAVTQALR